MYYSLLGYSLNLTNTAFLGPPPYALEVIGLCSFIIPFMFHYLKHLYPLFNKFNSPLLFFLSSRSLTLLSIHFLVRYQYSSLHFTSPNVDHDVLFIFIPFSYQWLLEFLQILSPLIHPSASWSSAISIIFSRRVFFFPIHTPYSLSTHVSQFLLSCGIADYVLHKTDLR